MTIPPWLLPWKWPEHIVSLMKAWQEYRKSKAEADVAVAVRGNAIHEAQVVTMMRRIHELQDEAMQSSRGNVTAIIEPGPGDDPKIFREAMRRIRNEAR